MQLFVYFSLHMHSFDHTTTSRLKSDVIFEFSAPFSYTGAVISSARHHFSQLLWR